MGWGDEYQKPTGYWLVSQENLKGCPMRIKASNELAARKKYKQMTGQDADFCEQETR